MENEGLKLSLIIFTNRLLVPKYYGYQYILCRNCLLKYSTVGKIEGRMNVTQRRGKRRKQLMDNNKETTGYCRLKEEALARTLYGIHFGIGHEPVERETTELIK